MDKIRDLNSSRRGESWAEECVIHSLQLALQDRESSWGTTLGLLHSPTATSQLCTSS